MNKAFVINLDTAEETFIAVQQELQPYGIECERLVVTRDSNKQIGCTITHLNLIAEAQKKKAPYLFVIEDDCAAREAMHAWPSIAEYLLKEKNQWDIFLGGALYVHPKKLHTRFQGKGPINLEMVECLHAVTAHFIIYNSSSYDHLLRWHTRPEPPEERPNIDNLFDNLRVLVPSPFIAWQKPHHGCDWTKEFERAEEKLHYFTTSLKRSLKYRLFRPWVKSLQ